MLLLSGGIDSPVAGHLISKRGVSLEAIHFESYPYTSELAFRKVLDLAKIMTDYCGSFYLHSISVKEIQEVLKDTCEEDYFTLLLRRFMMRIASRVAERHGSEALITGESLGQVASQTMQAIRVTEEASELPIFRPCIAMDKEEIISVSRKIDAFETSILPYEDCCTVFTPPHPCTKPKLEKLLEQEAKLDVEALIEGALKTEKVYNIG
jgi:thiamine biosynthesis protein ThiI